MVRADVTGGNRDAEPVPCLVERPVPLVCPLDFGPGRSEAKVTQHRLPCHGPHQSARCNDREAHVPQRLISPGIAQFSSGTNRWIQHERQSPLQAGTTHAAGHAPCGSRRMTRVEGWYGDQSLRARHAKTLGRYRPRISAPGIARHGAMRPLASGFNKSCHHVGFMGAAVL